MRISVMLVAMSLLRYRANLRLMLRVLSVLLGWYARIEILRFAQDDTGERVRIPLSLLAILVSSEVCSHTTGSMLL
jgi:hypothetical protein